MEFTKYPPDTTIFKNYNDWDLYEAFKKYFYNQISTKESVEEWITLIKERMNSILTFSLYTIDVKGKSPLFARTIGFNLAKQGRLQEVTLKDFANNVLLDTAKDEQYWEEFALADLRLGIAEYKELNFLKYELHKLIGNGEKVSPASNKLTWKGTPAHLALSIDLLIAKGYIEKPSPYAERNAELLLSLFEIEGFKPTKESLGKLLHKDDAPISNPGAIVNFNKIPDRNTL